jgi:hypothetical protein
VSSAEAALEAAMLGMLAADEGVRELLGDPLRVIHAGAPKPAYPYLEIVRHESAPMDGVGFTSNRHVIDIRVVSRDVDGALAREAMIAVRTALAQAFSEPAAMEGEWRCVLLAPVRSDVARLSDGSWRALQRLTAVVEPA